PVGQHLMLGPVGGGKDTPSRPYTPITIDRTTKGSLDLLIKTYPTGRLTPWIDQLKPGDEAFMSGPFGGFTYEGRGGIRIDDEITGEKRRLSCQSFTMFAGGTGITPMYQLLQAIAVDDEDTTAVDLHFCNRSVGDVLLFEELKAMEQASKGKFKITFYVDEGQAPEGTEEGILTSAEVKEIIAGSDSTGMVLGCGPPGMIDEALLPAMNATGVTSAQRGYIF
ncbi:hypothetical protein FOZ62_006298, partial [Perkinsus olseni]